MEHTVKKRQSVHARKQSCLAAVSVDEGIHAGCGEARKTSPFQRDFNGLRALDCSVRHTE